MNHSTAIRYRTENHDTLPARFKSLILAGLSCLMMTAGLARPMAAALPPAGWQAVERTGDAAITVLRAPDGAEWGWGGWSGPAPPAWTLGSPDNADCAFAPGLFIHDDGSTDTGYGPSIMAVDWQAVDRFTPTAYPATVQTACFAVFVFPPVGGLSDAGKIVVYADDGIDGAPGTLLGSVPFEIDELLAPMTSTPFQPRWIAVDLSALDVQVAAGSVYVGVGLSPRDDVFLFLAADTTADDRPIGHAGGYLTADGGAKWNVIHSSPVPQMAEYRALMVRASFDNGAPPLAYPHPYCSFFHVPDDVEPISLVRFAGIDNPTTATLGNASPALEDFLDLVAEVEAGGTYPMTVMGNTAGDFIADVRAYIDWNRDGQFGQFEAQMPVEDQYLGSLVNSDGADGQEVTAAITIPETVASGTYRMRVVKRHGVEGDSGQTNNPCANGLENFGMGQAEEYTINVTGGADDCIFGDGFGGGDGSCGSGDD